VQLLNRSKASFDALVDALVQGGNEIVGERWRCDKEGYHTNLRYPIDWALVYSTFLIESDDVLVYENSIATNPEAYEVIYRRTMKSP
jgi:hypothetical protein